MTNTFDTSGQCPICDHIFMSKDCKHPYEYVCKVIEAARTGRGQFMDDVIQVRLRMWTSIKK